MRSKKGVSPLVATVLLIAFSVALGAVVMNWGSNYVNEQIESPVPKSQQQLQCINDVKIDVIKVGETKICLGSNNVSMYIRNGQLTPLIDIQINILGSAEVADYTLGQVLGVAELKKVVASWTGDLGTIESVEIIPIIDIEGETVYCVQSSELIKDIGPC